MTWRIPHDLGRAIVALRVRVTAYIVPPLLPPLGIAKKEIMQMREAAVAVSRPPVVARRLMPAHLQFHVMSGFRRDFRNVRTRTLAPSPCTQKGFPSEVCQASERGRQRGFGLRGRDTRTGIMWAVRNEYLLPLWTEF